jgi:hypothetical protein
MRNTHKTLKILCVLLAGVAVGLTGVRSAHAVPITITDSKSQSGFSAPLYEAEDITSEPFDFSDSPLLTSVTGVELTFTMWDGDTAPGEFDHPSANNSLYLKLDGMEPASRWYIPGFPNQETATVTFFRDLTGDPTFANALLDQVGAGGDQQIMATIWDEDFIENRIELGEDETATLKITGTATVPEPATMLLLSVALAGCGVVLLRRRAKKRA